MLCEACQDIFSSPRKLAFGSYYPWKQDVTSFRAALRAGCHLCSLIEESYSYERHDAGHDTFPSNMRYAFKAINPSWARHGVGQKWLAPQIRCVDDDGTGETEEYLSQLELDPTPNGLAALLASDAHNLQSEAQNSWIALEFYGAVHLVLPMELASNDEAEILAQANLEAQNFLGSRETLELAKMWLRRCILNHPACQPRAPDVWFPTRLLDVKPGQTAGLHLVLGSSLDRASQYAALSHRWGAVNPGGLKKNNLAEYQEQIPVQNISQTVRDAIKVTQALGLRYLWVDCMCIVQDDDMDWTRESAKMSTVYGQATCTIAAANSGEGPEGFLAPRNQYRVRPCRVPSPFKMNSKHSFYLRSQYLNRIHHGKVQNSQWYRRGWVFQERTLSRRMLIFSGSQVLWSCKEVQAAETWPCGKTSENHIDKFESFEVETSRFNELLNPQTGVSRTHAAWWTFLRDYMLSAELTVRSDRLIALQGIATLVQNLTGQTYCGGFWLNEELAYSLLWKAAGEFVVKRKLRGLPSWSWAAIDGPVQLFAGTQNNMSKEIDILGYEQLPDMWLPGVEKSMDALRVAGRLYPVVLVISHTGKSCDRVISVGYKRALKWTTMITIKGTIAWRRCHDWWQSVLKTIWTSGIVWVVLIIVLIPLGLAAVALLIGLGIALLGVGPAIFLVWLVGIGIKEVHRRVAWRSTFFCFYCNRREKRLDDLDRARLEREARVRREEANARFERIFADLEQGRPLPEISKHSGEPKIERVGEVDVGAQCWLDTLLPRDRMLAASLLPISHHGGMASGLILVNIVDGNQKCYSRLGCFSVPCGELKKLPSLTVTDGFWLV